LLLLSWEFKRAFSPLLFFFPLSLKGESKGGGASLIESIPLPLIKGKGIKGIGIPIKIYRG